jgi:hypothetical protein
MGYQAQIFELDKISAPALGDLAWTYAGQGVQIVTLSFKYRSFLFLSLIKEYFIRAHLQERSFGHAIRNMKETQEDLPPFLPQSKLLKLLRRILAT